MTDLRSSNHPIEPTDRAYKEAEEIWRSASSVSSCCRQVLEYGVREGADYELEACCAWLGKQGMRSSAESLWLSRRPTLKTRALDALNRAVSHGESFASSEATKIIRKALENINE